VPVTLEDKLVIAIASTALFDLAEADRIYRENSLEAYREYQLANEDNPLSPGTAFPLVKGLLRINQLAKVHLVEVILLSRNDPDSGLRIGNSLEHWKLPIRRAGFTDGRPPFEYLGAFWCDLYLSTKRPEVLKAKAAGYPAAYVYEPPEPDKLDLSPNEVRIAFDCDAVIFSDEADRIYQQEGLEAFQKYEALHEGTPLEPGPLKGFLEGLSRIQKLFPETECPIRASIVTARSMPAHKRPVKTLRKWDIRLDEAFFLGGIEKARILKVLKPHIFFDDQTSNLEPARVHVPVAEVPADIDTGGEGR